MWHAHFVSKGIYSAFDVEATGSVHSVFNRSFNLVFAGTLVHIGASENGMAPFGIGVDQFDAQILNKKIKPGQTVIWDAKNKALHFISGDVLSLQSATVTDHSLPYLPFTRATLEKNFAFLAEKLSADKWQTGIVQTNEEKKLFLDYVKGNPSSTLSIPPVIKEFRQLQAVVVGQSIGETPVFDYWIGRGTGLTPSGDDILTGLCAAFAALDQGGRDWIEKLGFYLKQYGNKRTTAVSVAYLTYAVRFEFHSDLIKVMESLVQPDEYQIDAALEEMKKMGHTSGTDTLIGVLAGAGAVLYGGLNK